MVFFFAVLSLPQYLSKRLNFFKDLSIINFYNISVMRVSLAQTIDVICGKMDVLSESEVFAYAVLHQRWNEICTIMHCISIDICAWYETTIVSRSVCEKVNRR